MSGVLTAWRAWCTSPGGRRRLLAGGLCVAGTGGLVLLLSWVFGAHVLGTMVRALFTAATRD